MMIKDERIELLTEIGKEVVKALLEKHVAAGGNSEEIVFRPEKLVALVDEYSVYLETYRKRHIGISTLVGGDKIAAFTGVLIMRHWIIESATKEVNSVIAALANETYAVRIAELFVKKSTFHFTPSEHKQLLHCFAECYSCDNCMNTWTVATMAVHLAGGTYNARDYSD